VTEPRIRIRVTWLVAAALVATWVGGLAIGVDPTAPAGGDLVRVGANYGPRTFAGEWWRLLSAVFVHVGWIHLAINVGVLLVLGTILERRSGALGMVAVLLGSTLVASATSIAVTPYELSAGASGAIAGVCGALLVWLIFDGRSFPPPWRAVDAGLALAALGWGTLIAALGWNLDHAAHLGGVIAGAAIGGALLAHRRRGALAGVVLASVAAGVILSIAEPPSDWHTRAGELAALDQRSDQIIDAVGFRADGPRLARELEQEVLGPYRVALARFWIDPRMRATEVAKAHAFRAQAIQRLHELDAFIAYLVVRTDAEGDDQERHEQH
jgi:rhomboid protease GluP